MPSWRNGRRACFRSMSSQEDRGSTPLEGTQGEHKTWEQKGAEFQNVRKEMFEEEQRQQKLRAKATNVWLQEELKDVTKEEEVVENVV